DLRERARGVGGGRRGERLEEQQAARALAVDRSLLRAAVQQTGDETALRQSEPGAAREEVAAADDARRRREEQRRRGGPGEELVAIRRHDERVVGEAPDVDREGAHRAQYTRIVSSILAC